MEKWAAQLKKEGHLSHVELKIELESEEACANKQLGRKQYN